MSAVSPRVVAPRRPPSPALAPAAASAWRTPVAIAAVLALAVASQARFGAFGDISWLLTLGERWLDGQQPYIDFVETNPPASLLLYMPAVALARGLGIKPEITIVAQGLAVGVAMIIASAGILRRVGGFGPASPLVALVAVAILPGRTLDERDFFAALLGLPFLATCVTRALGGRVPAVAALLAGLGLGAMIAIKPPYALIPLVLAPYLLLKIGWRRLFAMVEAYAAAALLAAYAGLVMREFPAYVSDVLPTVTAAYLPVRETFAQLGANAGVLLVAALLGAAAGLAGRGANAPRVAVPALAALGATAAYFAQGKGWLYHLYPGLAFATLAVGAALDSAPRPPRELAAAAMIALLSYLGAAALGMPALPLAIGLLLASRFLVPGFGAGDMAPRLALLAGGALIGAACGLFGAPFPAPTAAFVRELQSLGPHPRIAAISEGLGAGFPLTRNVDGVWVQRTQGLLMTAGARYLIASHPDDSALAEKLAPIIDRDRDIVAEDITRNRPDAVLVGRIGTRFEAWALSDPVLKAALADYRRVAENAGKDWPYALYIRADKVGLREAPM
jgi:hypothetical protein